MILHFKVGVSGQPGHVECWTKDFLTSYAGTGCTLAEALASLHEGIAWSFRRLPEGSPGEVEIHLHVVSHG